jgi:hypothetical protein
MIKALNYLSTHVIGVRLVGLLDQAKITIIGK